MMLKKKKNEKKVTNCIRKACVVEIYPEDVMNINNFRDTVIEYFEKKTAVIKKLIRCDIVNVKLGNNSEHYKWLFWTLQ